MKVRLHKRRSRWSVPTVTLHHIKRDILSLLLIYAQEGIEKDTTASVVISETKQNLVRFAKVLDHFINDPHQFPGATAEIPESGVPA